MTSTEPPNPAPPASDARRIVLVSGLSGAGKASILRVLEDLGYEAVDNPPLDLMEDLVLRGDRRLAICVDTRSRGFDPAQLLAQAAAWKSHPELRVDLVFAFADEASLLRRFTETRRRHPLARNGRIAEGIAAEIRRTALLRDRADLLVDTSGLPLPQLRHLVERHFGAGAESPASLSVSLVSFAYPLGLPREADLVFDARFLRNPHYDPILRDKTGLHPDIAAYVQADPDFAPFMEKMTEMLTLLLPRFVQEGKKYLSIAVGCTGGKHRSVHVVQTLADRLRQHGEATPEGGAGSPWRIGVTHRELVRAKESIVGQIDDAQTDERLERPGAPHAAPEGLTTLS